ncbi:MAG: diguanylate cyclase, partial [Treponema sp.]|nr:diguanylate cyclase [Treponema sp.]
LSIDGIEYYAGYKDINGYTVVGLIPKIEYRKEINQVLIDTVLFVCISLIIIIVTIFSLIHRLLKPIEKVIEGLKNIAKGNFEARVEGNYTDEFALIKNAINDMAESITSHMIDKLNAQWLAHEVELEKHDLLLKVHYDALTGIYNRRYLDENLTHLMKLLSRSGGTLSVLMADIDYFKNFNDKYGHAEGDVCLRIIARTLNDSITRESDFVARYGGEEFCIILSNTDADGARHIAGKILEKTRALKITNEGSSISSFVTISIGGTTSKVLHTHDINDYIKRADEALYMSKQNGRDRYSFLG